MPEIVELESNAHKLPPQLRCLVIGPSQSGKTTFIKSLLRHRELLFNAPHDLILYVSPNLLSSSVHHEVQFIEEMRILAGNTDIKFLGEIPTVDELLSHIEGPDFKVWLIIDDYHHRLFENRDVVDYYIRLSSHSNLDILSTAHSAFSNGKFYQLIFRNSNCIILFRTLSDKSTDSLLNKKCFPGQPSFIREAFDQAIAHCGPHSYLCFQFNVGNILNHHLPVKTRLTPFINKYGQTQHLPIYFAWKEKKA